VPTYRRPYRLGQLLGGLVGLRIPPAWELELVVVDNDPAGSARAVVDAAGSLPMPVRYVVEPQRGIPQVRNRAVAEASGSDWILFLDDDQVPRPDWLEHLDRTQRETHADVTLGPSLSAYEGRPPAWLADGRFLDSERFATGTEVPYWNARTGGVLIRASAMRDIGPRPFDDRLALTGGEDHKLFLGMQHAGRRIVWCDEAEVSDFVPASRANLRWLMRRWFRIGITRTTILRLERPSGLRLIKRIGAGLRLIVAGIGTLFAGPDRTARIRALLRVMTGAGLIVGVFGVRYNEYRVTHGS
jgi:succinoglycan biosynthesis protein ExoM